MVRAEGLYDRGYLIDFGFGELVLYRNFIAYQQSTGDTYHIIKATDTLLSIARLHYGYSSLWYMIADVNDNIEDIFSLPVGETILVPSVPLIQSRHVSKR